MRRAPAGQRGAPGSDSYENVAIQTPALADSNPAKSCSKWKVSLISWQRGGGEGEWEGGGIEELHVNTVKGTLAGANSVLQSNPLKGHSDGLRCTQTNAPALSHTRFPSAGAYFHRPSKEVASRAKNATAANISSGFRSAKGAKQCKETYRVDDALECVEAIFDRKHLVLLVRDIGELSESQRKSVNKKQSRFNAAILLSSS